MSEMSKIVNCKLCGSDEMKNHLVDRTAEILTISHPNMTKTDLGVLGKMEKFLQIKMNDYGYFITSEVKIGNEHMSNIDVPIKYCPFCGRELE